MIDILLLKPGINQDIKCYGDVKIYTGDHRITNTTRHFFKKHIYKCIIYFDSGLHELNDLMMLFNCADCITLPKITKYVYFIMPDNSPIIKSAKMKDILLYIQNQDAEFNLVQTADEQTFIDYIVNI